MTADDDRVERERVYHDARYADETRERAGKYYETASESADAYLSRLTVRPGDRVLEYGCGTGSAAFDLAAQHAEVVGIDISPVAVEAASSTARERALGSVSFQLMNAESLTFPDREFDLVCGSGVLHHLDLSRAFPEVARVMRPGGRATFFEPMGHNPVINLYRRLTPKMRTSDEHPLLMDDFEMARRSFGTVRCECFMLLALAATPFRRLPFGSWMRRRLAAVDRWLFRRSALARRWAWTVVIDLSNPRSERPGP